MVTSRATDNIVAFQNISTVSIKDFLGFDRSNYDAYFVNIGFEIISGLPRPCYSSGEY